ncbi:ras and Rab interactor 1 [Ambystoma mexicanum]|uniref:ras and Rab interactor 1 n=1 Tax=Ambystoma mexicanum TaxID=8296 RepID=UPI0037E80F95
MDAQEETAPPCNGAPAPPSPLRAKTDPVYDYPDTCSPCRPVPRGSLKHVRVLDRLLLTQTVWLQLTVNSATALHILQREPPGTFLVRKSNTNQRRVLCVRQPDACGPSFVHHVYIREEHSELSLDGSELTFPDLFRLISAYCSARDVLPHVLRLPEAIEKANSHKQLEAISHLGVEFWNSSLNTREWSPGQGESQVPALDLSDCTTTPQPLDFSPSGLIKTRSPLELDCLTTNGALCFFNPLFLEEGVASSESCLKRGRFKKSIKVRVSTENSSPLSPPLNPPPPIPAEAIHRQRPGMVPLPKQSSEDQEYKQPKMSLRARLRRKISKGSFDIGLKAVPTLAPTREEDDYQVPRTGQNEQVVMLTPAVETVENSKDRTTDSESVVPSRIIDTETLDFDSKWLPSLRELDSSSLSSLDEVDVDGHRKYSSPQLQRKSITTGSRRTKTPFRAVSEVFLSFLPPEKKVLRAVEELARDRGTAFGNLVQDFLTLVRGRQKVPESCKVTLQAVRQFMSQMKKCLLEGSELNMPLQTMLPEEDQDGVMEKAMYRCVLKPLKRHLDLRLRRAFTKDGSLRQLKENLSLVREKGPLAFEVRAGLPGTQEVEKIRQKLVKMQKVYSPTDKVIILLQACKLMYNCMAARPGDVYGADDFLPVFSYVLALCDLPDLLLEVEYMMELLDPSLLMGEGGYYLTSLYASLTLLSCYHEQKPEKTEFSIEFKKSLTLWHRRRAGLPSFNDFQNFLRIGYQDSSNGCTSKTLVVRPSDTVESLCRLCAQKFKLDSQEGYGIFLYIGGEYQRLAADAHPQEIKSALQSQEASFYFVYRRVEEGEVGQQDEKSEETNETDKEEKAEGEKSCDRRLLRGQAIDMEDGS